MTACSRDEDFVSARQVNFETIHNHDVLAERSGTVGGLRTRARDRSAVAANVELRDWLQNGA